MRYRFLAGALALILGAGPALAIPPPVNPPGGGTGTVTGPGSSVSGDIATFSSTTGTALSDGGKALPTGAIVGTTDTQTLTNKSITSGQITGLAASATTDATNASNISSGTLAAARGGAGTITGALKGNGAGLVSQAAAADLSNGVNGSGAVVLTTSPALVTPSLGVATATSLNGAAIDNLAWSTYTPTVSCTAGTLTTATTSGDYKIIGKTVLLRISELITTVGTCTGSLTFSLPASTAASSGVFVGAALGTSSTTSALAAYLLNSGVTMGFASAPTAQNYYLTITYQTP